MIKSLKYICLFFVPVLVSLQSCTDDVVLTEPSPEIVDDFDYSDVPDEIKNGYSVSFMLTLDPLGGISTDLTRAEGPTGRSLKEIEDFVDLEKLRILFFASLDENDRVEKTFSGKTKTYHTGKHDIFLFESKSRWVSMLSTAEASEAQYQVTAPVFTYGNNDEYDWAYIREVLTTCKFKVVILVNRPDRIRYSDFDGSFQTNEEFYFGNRGPYWGVKESEDGKADYYFAKRHNFRDLDKVTGDSQTTDGKFPAKGTTINQLHHCQWDPVYTNKNKGTSTGGERYYNFIIENPAYDTSVQYLDENEWILAGRPNAMGAVSAWTKRLKHTDLAKGDNRFNDSKYYNDSAYPGWITNPDDSNKPFNFYVLPDKQQAIPMYGCQIFDAVPNWKEGTPLNLSAKKAGQDASYTRTTIALLRSLARLDLYIPKTIGTVTEPCLMYSNVFGRCEPMDVATPTNELWDKEHDHCEFNEIFNYGPIGLPTNSNDETSFLRKMAWFYGVWEEWGWNFNGRLSANGINLSSYTSPSPRIFNTCIQRNGTARLDYIAVDEDDPANYHFVVYTGERNINDPSKFANLSGANAEICYFRFKVNGNNYCFAINPYNSGSKIRQDAYMSSTNKLDNFRTDMTASGSSIKDWNWPIMRNHWYTFTVKGINNTASDADGLPILVIATEERHSPTITYQ